MSSDLSADHLVWGNSDFDVSTDSYPNWNPKPPEQGRDAADVPAPQITPPSELKIQALVGKAGRKPMLKKDSTGSGAAASLAADVERDHPNSDSSHHHIVYATPPDSNSDMCNNENSEEDPSGGAPRYAVGSATSSSLPRPGGPPQQGEFASRGSAFHFVNKCTPCLFVNTSHGCENGAGCDFCHLYHKPGSKPRPCKAKRDRVRKLITQAEERMEDARTQSKSMSNNAQGPSRFAL